MDPAHDAAETIRQAMLRHIGVLDEWERNALLKLHRRPLALMAEGVQWIITLPLQVARSVGLLPTPLASRLRQGTPARVVAALVRDLAAALGFFFETDLVAICRLLSIDSTRVPFVGHVQTGV